MSAHGARHTAATRAVGTEDLDLFSNMLYVGLKDGPHGPNPLMDRSRRTFALAWGHHLGVYNTKSTFNHGESWAHELLSFTYTSRSLSKNRSSIRSTLFVWMVRKKKQ